MSDSNKTDEAGGRGALIWVLRGLGVLVGLIVLALVFVMLWIPSESGRSYVSEKIESYASDGMGGSMKIGSIDEIKFFQGPTGVRAKATDVRFLAPDGREALHVGDADVTMGLAAILGGTVDIREAVASNGTLTIEMDENDKLTIENAFVLEDGAPPSENIGLNLRHMNARNMRAVLKSDPETSYEVVGIDGTVFVTRPEGGEFVTTELVDVNGEVEKPQILGKTLSFSELQGLIASEQTPMVKMSVLLALDEGTIDTRLSVEPDGEPKIKLRMWAEGDTEVQFLTSAARLGSFFGSSFSVDLSPIEDDSK